MTKSLRIKGVRRKHIDEDKIALAYLLLAKQIIADRQPDDDTSREGEDEKAEDGRAA